MAAAALQAHGRAALVGVPTSGIGSIQAIVPLPGKNALRLTTAYWFSPREHRIEGNPLQPDVQVEAQGGSPVKLIDPQRQAALELLRAKASGG